MKKARLLSHVIFPFTMSLLSIPLFLFLILKLMNMIAAG
jgi:hypothetical protein